MWSKARALLVRLAALMNRRRREDDFDEAIQHHLTLLQERFMQQDMDREEAWSAARRVFGGIDQTKEQHRETRSFIWLEQFLKDFRYSARNLLRNPGFTLFVVLALALGIGANATIFALYNAVGLKRLPVAHADSVVRIKRWLHQVDTSDEVQYNFELSEYEHLREQSGSFAGLVAQTPADYERKVFVSMPSHSISAYVIGTAASANYFDVLGVPPMLGRTFAPGEDRLEGANAVVVLGHWFWERRLHNDPNVIGRPIRINGQDYTIIGVMPRWFTGTELFPVEPAFWAP